MDLTVNNIKIKEIKQNKTYKENQKLKQCCKSLNNFEYYVANYIYDKYFVNQKELIIPHKLMHERNFVMIPLNDLNKNHLHPILKISNKEILNKCIDSCKVKYYGN